MNVNEMHLAIQQGVDKINSLQADTLLREEIDLELNKSQIKFINTKYGKNNLYRRGFEESQKRIDDLRTLVKEYEDPVTFKERLSVDIWVDKFLLPNDYMYLVNQRSDVWINNCDPITYNLVSANPINYFTLDLNTFICNNEGGNSTDFIGKLKMLADPDDPTAGEASVWSNISGFNYPVDTQNLLNEILNLSSSPLAPIGFEFYWEQFGNINVPGQIIVIVDTNIHPWFNWDGSVTNAVSGSQLQTIMLGTDSSNNTLTTAYAQFSDTAFDSKRDPVDASELVGSVNKFIQQDDIFSLLDDPFNTTKYTRPLTTIRGNYIDIYTSDIFIIDKLKITYIRKPAQISLTLGVNCELPEHSHREIVDMAVSSILEGISDPRYKTQQLELSKNE